MPEQKGKTIKFTHQEIDGLVKAAIASAEQALRYPGKPDPVEAALLDTISLLLAAIKIIYRFVEEER
jgi:hypothetical protein